MTPNTRNKNKTADTKKECAVQQFSGATRTVTKRPRLGGLYHIVEKKCRTVPVVPLFLEALRAKVAQLCGNRVSAPLFCRRKVPYCTSCATFLRSA